MEKEFKKELFQTIFAEHAPALLETGFLSIEGD